MNNIYFSVAVLSALLSAAGFADSTTCSDSCANWSYQTWTYSGGAAPPNHLVTYKRQWAFLGKTFEVLQGSQEEPAPAADVVDNIDSDDATMLESHGDPVSGGKTFAQLVTLKRRSGKEVVPGSEDKTVSIYMICQSVWIHNLP